MISVSIIGSGNVASHLTDVFLKAANVSVIQVFSRNIESVKHLKNKTSTTDIIENLKEVDVCIIAIPDDSIIEISSKIKNSLVVHTSGNLTMSSLENNGRKGIFYPLQSFSKNKNLDFSKIPFCLETENKKDLALLETLAKAIGNKVYYLNYEQRKSLHIAAVFVNNFVNHLYKIGSDICYNNNVSFRILQPLIEETARKIRDISPVNAQTGPAIRKDENTIENHLKDLNNHQQEIYKLLTKSIQQSDYGTEL